MVVVAEASLSPAEGEGVYMLFVVPFGSCLSLCLLVSFSYRGGGGGRDELLEAVVRTALGVCCPFKGSSSRLKLIC